MFYSWHWGCMNIFSRGLFSTFICIDKLSTPYVKKNLSELGMGQFTFLFFLIADRDAKHDKLIMVNFHYLDNHQYLHRGNFKELSTSLMYSPILMS